MLYTISRKRHYFLEYAVDFVFFSDEKVITVASPVNLQNDRVYTRRAMRRSATSLLNACCVVGQRSRRWWYIRFCLKNGLHRDVLRRAGEWKWTADTTARFYWRSRCWCQSCVALPVTVTSLTRACSSRTAHRRTVLARQFSCCSRRRYNLSPPICGLLTVRTQNRSTTGSGIKCNNACMKRLSATPTTWSIALLTSKQIFRGSCSPGSAETLVRRGGITNRHLIAYFLSNISATNFQNRLIYVEVIVCSIIVVFWDTVCIHIKRNSTLISKIQSSTA